MIKLSSTEHLVLSTLATQCSSATEEQLHAVTKLPLQTIRECLVTLLAHGFVQARITTLPE